MAFAARSVHITPGYGEWRAIRASKQQRAVRVNVLGQTLGNQVALRDANVLAEGYKTLAPGVAHSVQR